ncbi:hypothetical protein J6590_102023 [Homalodisca vitripennis]|nr:hypothetical protein J6590_102023 [Homalodisca vitripennis]
MSRTNCDKQSQFPSSSIIFSQTVSTEKHRVFVWTPGGAFPNADSGRGLSKLTNGFKGDIRTTTNSRAGGLLARTGSLSGHPSKQQPRSTMLDLVILR